MKTKTIFHVITGLGVGGAESMLAKLISEDKLNHNVIISLVDGGFFANKIREMNYPVFILGMKKNPWSFIKAFVLLVRLFYRYKPKIALFWMYHSCFMSLLVRVFYWKPCKMIWNIRHTPNSLSRERFVTIAVIKLLKICSRMPFAIIFNSPGSKKEHESMGYFTKESVIIPNGFDTDLFKPSSKEREYFFSRYHLEKNTFLLGHVARFHPMKDHRTLLEAFNLVLKKLPNARLVLCGRGVNWENKKLVSWLSELQITQYVILLDEHYKIETFYPVLDMFILSSAWGESFPNVVGEAMSCGVPCLVTDVGGSAWIVGDTGSVVCFGDPVLLADAMFSMVEKVQCKENDFGGQARERIKKKFSLLKIFHQYENLYKE